MSARPRRWKRAWMAGALVGAAILAAAGAADAGAFVSSSSGRPGQLGARTAASCSYSNYDGCPVWFGLSRPGRVLCKPGCPHGGIRSRHPWTPGFMYASDRKVTYTNVSLACDGGGWGVGGSLGNVKVSPKGRFSYHYHYRNPQSGDTVNERFSGHFSGDRVSVSGRFRYGSAGGRFCQTSVQFSGVLTHLLASAYSPPGWFVGHYSGESGGASVQFNVVGDQINPFNATVPLQCSDGSQTSYPFNVPPLTLTSDGHGGGTATVETPDGGQADIDLGTDGIADVDLQATTEPSDGVSCSPPGDNGVAIKARNPIGYRVGPPR